MNIDMIGTKVDGFLPKIGGFIGSALGGVGGFFSSLVSMKLLAGIAAGVFLVMGFTIWTTTKQRDAAVKTTNQIGAVVAGIAGVDPSKVKTGQIIATLQTIGKDRDTARREASGFKEAAARQTTANKGLALETKTAKANADKAVSAVAIVTHQRDAWIAKAKIAATRTDRKAAELELKQTEEVLDALYQNGF